VALAKAALAAAEASAAASVAPPAPAAVAAAKAAIAQAREQLALQKLAMADLSIRAPVSGLVLAVDAGPGAEVGVNTAVVELAQGGAQAVQVQAQVPENDIMLVHAGEVASLALPTAPPVTLHGKVAAVAPLATSAAGVPEWPIEVNLGDPRTPPPPGMNVSVDITAKVLRHVIVIPSVALEERRGVVGVLVVRGAKARAHPPGSARARPTAARRGRKHKGHLRGKKRRSANPQGLRFVPVVTGLVTPTQVQIVRGLRPGERIALVLPQLAAATPKGLARNQKALSGGGFAKVTRGGLGGIGGIAGHSGGLRGAKG
jgi:HlyD family secretion protein